MDRSTRTLRLLCLAIFAGLLLSFSPACASPADDVTIIDARHYSNVFGEVRNYRVFLPKSYFENPEKRFPVIYFYHGWSQRYFGSSNPYGDFDQGEDNGGDNIANFVAGHEVIVVKPDGYNRSPDEKYYVRPYNVTPVETYRQFPLYFPELVEHIDAHYRTLADRGHRGIAGLSMGGFMTFWIGGKYPHLLSAAGNFCGSPEFTIGPKDFPVEYRHLDMHNNYGGMNLRLHYGDKDFIRGYHEDLNRVWPQLIDNYDHKIFDAAHSTCGMSEMLSFILKTFESPPSRPAQWGHTDVYPVFSVWDYTVMTDRTVPGFTVLEKIDARGFRSAVREFLPDGGLLPFVKVTVITAPLYEKNQLYTINALDTETAKAAQYTVRSDAEGRLTINLNGRAHEVGINRSSDKPNLSILSASVQASRWATHGKDIQVAVKILNKGQSPAKNVTATLTPFRPTAQVKKHEVAFGTIGANEVATGKTPLVFRVDADTVEIIKFKLTLRDDRKNVWIDHFIVPVRKDLPELNNIVIADGRSLKVANAGNDTATVMLGKGNGDGVANPGESIVILVNDQEKLWRTDLTTSDPHINPFGINVRKSDYWGAFDHVGGSAKYDVPLISSNCPEDHALDFFAEYWLPEYPLHIIKQGTVRIHVKGRDTTPPLIGMIQVTGDNVLMVQAYDGAKVRSVNATLVKEGDEKTIVECTLADDGSKGDRVANDLVFSQEIPRQVFGIFRVKLEAVDAYGNKTVHEPDATFVVH